MLRIERQSWRSGFILARPGAQVKLLKREEYVLHVRGPDAYDGTPVLDIKPYPDWERGRVRRQGALSSAGFEVTPKYHLHLRSEYDSFLTATTQMWGAMGLYVQGEEQEREYVKGMRPTPVEPEFAFAYFNGLTEDVQATNKQSA